MHSNARTRSTGPFAMLLRRLSLVFLLGAHCEAANSEVVNRLNGIPLYEIFTEKDIRDSSENHSIATAPDGSLYLCNENGVHLFDGTKWKRLLDTKSTREKIRCLIWTEQGIYGGGYQKVGKLTFAKESGVSFDKLNVEPLALDSGEVYNEARRIGNYLYFAGATSIARVDLQTDSVDCFEITPYIKSTFVFGESLLVSISDSGLGQFTNDGLALYPNYARFTGRNCITDFASTSNGDLFFSTQSGQVFRVERSSPIGAAPELVYTAPNTISNIESIGRNELALAIPRQGITIIDEQGTKLQTLDKSIDYRLGGCNALHLDEQGTLWTLFSNKVGKILINLPITEIDERLRPNLHYPIAFEYGDDVYISNEGKLYRSDHDEYGQLLGFVDALPEFDRSVSVANVSNGAFHLVAEGDAYRLENSQLTHLGETGRVERLDRWELNPNLFLGASANDLRLIEFQENGIRVLDTVPHSVGLINKIAQSENGVFWLEIGLSALIKVEIVETQLRVTYYDASKGLPDDWIAVWEHQGEVYFTERTGIFTYDDVTDSIVRTSEFADYFPAFGGTIHRVASDSKGNIWASYKKSNYILWKQDDGSYLMDSRSLEQMGALFANQFCFLAKGDTLVLTSGETIHVDASKLSPSLKSEFGNPGLVELGNAMGDEIYFHNLGSQGPAESLNLPSAWRSLSFTFNSPYAATIQPPDYQYFLEGLSKEWSRWGSQNQIAFNNLNHGNYRLLVRSRTSNSEQYAEGSVGFSIAPTFWETPLAMLGYALASLLLLFIGYCYLSRNLKSANERLEKTVAERTREIENKNAELNQNAEKLQVALDELRRAQDELMGASRKAGMAEVATNVLHNVGNVLNSINVGVNSLSKRIQNERIAKLVKITELVRAHEDDLANFLQNDRRGQSIPLYLEKLAQVLLDDFQRCKVEIECMDENIEHVKRIINTQQYHAKPVDLSQEFDLADLIESAVSMILNDMDHMMIEISRDIEPGLRLFSDKHLILQMVTNVIKNAKESILEAGIPVGLITVSAARADDQRRVRIQVSDNGIGVSSENLSKIFTHGFTTKNEGHGFGMHSCANSAKALGGQIAIASDGVGKGATVTLTLPLKPEQANSDKRHNRLNLEPSAFLSRN